MKTLEETVKQRDALYGGFDVVAFYSQEFKKLMQRSPNWDSLTHVQKEGLDMIVHKMARMLCGDPAHMDNPVDIAGYSKVMLDYMQQAAQVKEATDRCEG